jgi:hypothetical protein
MTLLPEDNKQTLIATIITFVLTPAGVTLLLFLLALSTGAATWTYNLGKDVGISAAANYSTADRLKLDKLAQETRDAAAELRQATAGLNQLLNADEGYKKLKIRYDEIVAAQKNLSEEKQATDAKLRDATDELDKVQAALSKIVLGNDTYAISDKKAVMIADDNLFTVLVQILYSSVDKYRVSFNGDQKDIAVGDKLQVPGLKGKPCTIFVKEYRGGERSLLISASCD